MLAVTSFTVQVADVVLLLSGTIALVGVVVAARRRGRWREPLAAAPVPRGGPTLAGVVVVVGAFIVVQYFAVSALRLVVTVEGDPEPGSDAWHWSQVAGNAAGVMIAALMAAMMAAARRPSDGRRAGVAAGSAAAVLAFLVVLPITTVQAETGRIIWHWLRPDTAPPVHVVLQALSCSEWGPWGTVQLVLGAVVVAPLVEELFFRGVVMGAICHHFGRAWPALTVSAIAFGLAHAQPQDVVPLISLGLVLGYLRLRCRTLWPCILLHVLFNARTMTFVLLAPELLDPES